MAEPPAVLIAGGSGVFGRLLARELLDSTNARIVLAGRNRKRLDAALQELSAGERIIGKELDLSTPEALSRAASEVFAVVCAAGPFQTLSPGLPGAAVRKGCHWLDLSDDREWVTGLLSNSVASIAARKAGVAVMTGMSTVPGLSGFLARLCRDELPGATRARITLWIGNRNAKGAGAVASALGSLRGPAVLVELPVGDVRSYSLDSPDAALLKSELGLEAEFRVAFEWKVAGRFLAAAAPAARRFGSSRIARALSLLSAPFSHFGREGGCLQTELWSAEDRKVKASLLWPDQRLAVLPCAFALEDLISGKLSDRGILHPATWLSTGQWSARLREKGAELLC